jgi:hypothetical protein
MRWSMIMVRVGRCRNGHAQTVSRQRFPQVGEGYWLPDVHKLSAIIHAAHQAGLYVHKVGRSADRFDLLLAPIRTRIGHQRSASPR